MVLILRDEMKGCVEITAMKDIRRIFNLKSDSAEYTYKYGELLEGGNKHA